MAKLFLDGFPLVSPESVLSLTSNDFRQQSMSLMQENALHSIFAEKHYGICGVTVIVCEKCYVMTIHISFQHPSRVFRTNTYVACHVLL